MKNVIKLPAPGKFNHRQLAVLEWLLAAPSGVRRFLVTSMHNVKFCETGDVREDGMVSLSIFMADDRSPNAKALLEAAGGRLKFDPYQMAVAGLLASTHKRHDGLPSGDLSFDDKVAGIFIPGKWAFGSTYYEIAGDDVAEWFREKGGPRLAALRSKAQEKASTTRRRAVFGRRVRIDPAIPKELSVLLPTTYSFDLPTESVLRPCVVATVIEETEKRLRVTDVESINGNSAGWLGLTIGHGTYFEREYLILDNATDAEVEKLAAFDAEYVDEVTDIALKAYSEIIPVLARMADRLRQKKGQHDDMLTDILRQIGEGRTSEGKEN